MNKGYKDFFWDLWCLVSLVGIWPRFIEPRLLKVSRHHVRVPGIKKLKVVQFSDLHLHSEVEDAWLDKITKKILAEKPDLIVFTGDFVCYSDMREKERLVRFFSSLQAPLGCYAILGNHDYAKFVSINDEGDYGVIKPSKSQIGRAFRRLWSERKITGKVTQEAQETPVHSELVEMLKQTPFKLLHNENVVVDGQFNLLGLGEYYLDRADMQAFEAYNSQLPGLILAHNPDLFPQLMQKPGDIILSGHTHGGQVNLPWFWKKFTLMENPQYKSGVFKENGKWFYVNRGVGSVLAFRWNASPEILSLTVSET